MKIPSLYDYFWIARKKKNNIQFGQKPVFRESPRLYDVLSLDFSFIRKIE